MRLIFDVEVNLNFVLCGFKEFNTDNFWFFEYSERKDERHKLKSFVHNNIIISFNGIHYDNLILNALIKKENFNQIQKLNDAIISDNYQYYKHYKYKNFKTIDVDLFLYWSKMLRLSKKISLKSLMVQMNMPLIQELPYKSSDTLTYKQMDEVINYNINDLNATEELAKRKENEIKLRFDIKKNQGFNCLSWDQIKLASETLLKEYCKETNKRIKEVRDLRFNKSDIYLKNLINISFKTKQFNNLVENLKNSCNTFSEKVLFSLNKTNILLSYGIGGLHSKNVNQKFFTDSKYQLLTSDVASLYPNVIINYKTIRFKEVLNHYVKILNLRIKAKHKLLEKDNDLYNKFFKLVLNGVSGLIDNTYSWLYYPEGAMKLRITGQLILTKLIEEAALNNFNVVSANTDGRLKCPSIQ